MYQRNDGGMVIDPPTIPHYERAIYDAMQRADELEIEELTREYETARNELANKRDKREREQRENQEARDAEARQVIRDRNPPQVAPFDTPQGDPQDDPTSKRNPFEYTPPTPPTKDAA